MKIPLKIPLKLNEGEDYEYLDVDNPYNSHYDSSQGGTSTVGSVEGDSSETKSPIELTAVRNQYWMDRSLGGSRGFNYSMMTTKPKLGESVKVLKYLTERDVLVVPSQNPPMEEDPNMGMDMGGEEEMSPMEEDPNMSMGGGDMGMEEDPNVSALMQLLQSSDPDTIEAVKKYAEGITNSDEGGGEQMPPTEEDPNMGMEEDPNATAPPPQQQMESIKRNLDEIINDYLDDIEKPITPTISKNLGSGGNSSLKSKMFNPLKSC